MKKEYNILNYFNMRALFMGVGISKILNNTGEHFWLTLILGTLLGVFFLFLFRIELKKSWLNVVSSSLLIIFALIILINLISSVYLTEMPKFIIGLPLILLLLYILSKKEIVIFRVANILLVLNLFFYSISLLSLLPYFSIKSFSYTNTPIQTVFLSALDYALFSVVPVLITKKKEYSGYSLIKTYIISSITMAVIFFLTYGILGPNLAKMFRYPEYIILKKISIANAFENVQNIISFMWIFDIFMFLVSAGNCLKDHIPKKKILFPYLILLLFITSILNKYYIFILSTYKYATWILLTILFFILIANKNLIFKKK